MKPSLPNERTAERLRERHTVKSLAMQVPALKYLVEARR
jgi:hypothetical protein